MPMAWAMPATIAPFPIQTNSMRMQTTSAMSATKSSTYCYLSCRKDHKGRRASKDHPAPRDLQDKRAYPAHKARLAQLGHRATEPRGGVEERQRVNNVQGMHRMTSFLSVRRRGGPKGIAPALRRRRPPIGARIDR